jgi:hypothetical protein
MDGLDRLSGAIVDDRAGDGCGLREPHHQRHDLDAAAH